jgi:hypothetical protein
MIRQLADGQARLNDEVGQGISSKFTGQLCKKKSCPDLSFLVRCKKNDNKN